MTTFMNYGQVTDQRQKEIILDLTKPKKEIIANADEIAEAVVRKMKKG